MFDFVPLLYGSPELIEKTALELDQEEILTVGFGDIGSIDMYALDDNSMDLTKILLNHISNQLCNSLFLDGNICFSDKHAVSINYMLDLCDPRQLIA